MTLVRPLRFTMSSPSITSAGGRVPRGTGVMCTSQGLLSKAHDGPLYLLNHAYDGVRCGFPMVIREAPSECQMMICSANPYNQRLATLSTYHQLTPMPRRHHIYDVGGRAGSMLYNTWVPGGPHPLPRAHVTCCECLETLDTFRCDNHGDD